MNKIKSIRAAINYVEAQSTEVENSINPNCLCKHTWKSWNVKMPEEGLGQRINESFLQVRLRTLLHRTNMASKSLQKTSKNKWAIDFTARPRCMQERKSEAPPPVGYTDMRSFPAIETHDSDLSKLVAKKSWNIALGPMKQLPMNLFIMYMAGNSISIFPIMIVGMMIFKPIKAMLTLKATFKMLDGDQGILLKLTYILGNIFCLMLAVYKCHSMGILPTAPSDWLAFKEHRQRVEYIIGGLRL